MTQEEKAKRYDEAFDRARKLKEDPTFVFFPSEDTIADYIFPELKESEDEKISKVLVDYFKRYKELEECDIKTFFGIPTDNIITWLEKQGDKDELIKELGEYKAKYTQEVLEKHLRVMNKDDERLRKTTISFLKDFADKGYENAVECIDWLEKQSEQKSQGKTALEAIKEEKVDNSNRVEPKDYNSIDPHFMKPVDKVEPKFHEGEWVVNKLGDLWHIDSFDKKNYQVSDGKGNYDYFPISKQDEMHLWTIQDAKDGDVLVCEDFGYTSLMLFKSLSNGRISLHCWYNSQTNNFHINTDVALRKDANIYPATKEQRDKLEKEMADAGYTFDFEKKELKKIEDEIEIPFGAKDSELQEDTYYIPKGFHAEIDEDKVAIKKGELNIRKLESLVKQIWATAEHENDKDTIHKMSDLSFFLKTLKPQLKQEWSEEDEYCRHQLIVFCENCMVQDDGAKRCAHWLKSIKDRFTWRASDEQMIALNDVITNGHLSNANERILKGLQDQLKKLK